MIWIEKFKWKFEFKEKNLHNQLKLIDLLLSSDKNWQLQDK